MKVVKDFLPILEHMHVKDWNGTRYCPLGQGQVDIAGVLDLIEASGKNPDLNVELDGARPMTPLEAAEVSKTYLQKLGYKFAA